MYKEKIKKVLNNIYELPKLDKMLVSGRIFASDILFEKIEERCINQLMNVATLPGIVGYSLAMPDVHSGYGFPVGGVAAFDVKKGIISPGGIGYDINCGVRLLATNLDVWEFLKKREQIVSEIFKNVPSGVGKGTGVKLNDAEINSVLENGAKWALEKGFATKKDLECTEDGGCLKNADAKKLSPRAKARGRDQLGTIGAGNHFVEVQEVEKIFDKDVASAFGLDKKGQIVVMIHTGSRGLGHQTASDYILKMEKEYGFSELPDRELACAPIDSVLGRDYLAAMAGAANFAFCNRQLITHQIRNSFLKFFSNAKIEVVYDVAHNIAKFEEFMIDRKKKMLCVHRKGATRSFGIGREELPKKYRKIGQPVLIPGSMGTSSYVLVGTAMAREISFASTAHGAGRAMSRTFAKNNLTVANVRADLEKKNILLRAGSEKGIVEEAPQSYKDVDEVVRVSDELGIGKLVAKLIPVAVVKG